MKCQHEEPTGVFAVSPFSANGWDKIDDCSKWYLNHEDGILYDMNGNELSDHFV
jgi:hypothetical protein